MPGFHYQSPPPINFGGGGSVSPGGAYSPDAGLFYQGVQAAQANQAFQGGYGGGGYGGYGGGGGGGGGGGPSPSSLYAIQDNQAALRGQLLTAPMQYGISKAELGNNMFMNTEGLNKTQEDVAASMFRNTYQLGQTEADITAQTKANQRGVAEAIPKVKSQAAAQGALTSKGARQNYDDTWFHFLQGQEGLDRQREAAQTNTFLSNASLNREQKYQQEATYTQNAVLNQRNALLDAQYFIQMAGLNQQQSRPAQYGGLQ